MSGLPAAKLNESLDMMIDEMKLMSQGTKPYFRLSIIVFGSGIECIAEAKSEQLVDKEKITSFSGRSGSTNMAAALREAATILQRNPGKPTDFDPYIFLLTDGHPDDPNATLDAAEGLRRLEVAAGKPRLIAVGLGEGVNMPFLEQIASVSELAKHLNKPEDLVRFFPVIGTVVSSAGGTSAVDQAIIDI
jgi:uncharacterized protein YegL